ncbi:MAG: rod shape-determining protein MreC [Bacteroidales bacterium]|nr:rod shape-determining protein MreC [Bacteroidales bacterium]
MRELLQFFIRNSKWFVFAIYVVASCVLLFTFNPYQHHVYLTSASRIAGGVYGAANHVTSYFNLRENNEDLNRRNVTLQNEVLALREQIQTLRERHADTSQILPMARHYDFIVCHVINNSVMRPYNYITVNKGSNDGVAPEMGVIDQNGVVGIVNVVTPNYARVISVLNPHFRFSCKIKGDESFGSLVWDGKDPRFAVLEELPRHTVCHRGDTVVTSGYSAVFPPGLPVGIVESNNASDNDNFFSLRIRLLSDFTKLNNVQIVRNNNAAELNMLDEANSRTEGSVTDN